MESVYIPGFRELLVLLLIALLLFVGVVTRSPLLPAFIASALLAWLVWRRKEQLLERVYGERVLLLKPVEVKFPEAQGVKYAKVEVLQGSRRKAELYGAFVRVRDYDPPRGSLGKTAERALAAFHHPSARVTLAAVLREGGYDYYVGLWAPDLRVLKAALGDAARSLLSAGLYAVAVDAEEALASLGSLEEKRFGFKPPLFALAFALLIALSALAGNPLPAALALPLLPLLPYELPIARGGALHFVPARARVVVNTAFSVDETSVSSMVRSVAAVSQVAPPGSFVAACLAPADAALLEAKARSAMEVLDAARAGASRLREELKASRWLQVWRALQDGAAPFVATAVASEELARELAKCGLQPRGASLLAALDAIIPLDAAGELQVSHQLAWLAPHVFLRPRTRRTPRAIYLGRGLRRDEEVWLELDLLENVHGLIVGPMGSGKSTTARTIALRALERGIVPIIVDPSGEYRKFAERLGWEIIDLTDRKLDLGACQAFDLVRALECVTRGVPLSDWEFQEIRRKLEAGDLWSARVAVLDLVRPYFYPPSVSVKELLGAGKPFVLCLGSSASGRYVPMPVEIQRFAFLALLAQLRDYVLAQGLSEPRWMLVVDEAHLLARPLRGEAESPAATMARMLRKFGLALVMLTHDWRDIDDSYVRHCGWRLALSHSDPSYVEDTRVYMALTPSELSWFQRGLRGRAVLRRGFEPHNILVEVEPADVARPEVYAQG
ncbi:MAG: DUF87 domain-containing protein [Thermofilum sp.]|nr:DUF87 domain-containing protein [Thermofilum sp.]